MPGTAEALAALDTPAPEFERFMGGDSAGEPIALPLRNAPTTIAAFHEDPAANPLSTPSGRIEICSDLVARAGLPRHPAWIEPMEWLGAECAAKHPFQLVANQPRNKLHSQLDFGAASMADKHQGRERARLNPEDAARLGLRDGDVIRIHNDRGGLLAVARLDAGIAAHVVQLATGAWYAPVDLPGVGVTCVNGNPNAVTADIGASALSQGSSGQLCLVSVERWSGPVPETIPHEEILPRPGRND